MHLFTAQQIIIYCQRRVCAFCKYLQYNCNIPLFAKMLSYVSNPLFFKLCNLYLRHRSTLTSVSLKHPHCTTVFRGIHKLIEFQGVPNFLKNKSMFHEFDRCGKISKIILIVLPSFKK